MDSLANYESENSNNSEDSKMEKEEKQPADEKHANDANYDPVQMDMSEDSNNNNSSEDSENESNHTPPMTKPPTIENQGSTGKSEQSRTSRTSPSDQRHSDSQSSSCRGESKKSEKSARTSDEKCRRSSNDERRHRDSDHKDSRRSRDDDKRSSRDEERRRNSSSKDDRKEERDRSEKDHHHRDDRREHRRDRDRRHSRSDRAKDRHERSSHAKEKDRPRSRSRSKDRSAASFRSMSYRDEKSRNKLAQLEKLGIELKAPEGATTAQSAFGEKNFYNPLATAMQGKYAEQIQKRKLLWANKSKQEDGKSNPGVGSANNTWVGTTFTHDQDGKMSAKFKRLMGIKGEQPVTQAPGQKPDILKKQEEMFNNMEQQYEVARATTHTQRGVGLGYASSGYQFPR